MTLRTLEARVRQWSHTSDAALRRPSAEPACVDFSSSDYLALSTHPHVMERFADAVEREGCGSTGSRLLRGDRRIFGDVEQRMADFKGAPRSIYFSSGYLANIGVMTTMMERGDVVFLDERSHVSLADGARLSGAVCITFPHNNVARLADMLAGTPANARGQRFVVVESLFGIDGDFAPLAEYAAMCRSTGALLVVDEAHAIGVYGARGSGLIEACAVQHDMCVSINPASTALGVSGAFVCGPDWAIELLLQQARPFVFSTAPPPAVAAAIDASLDVVCSEPERRERLADRVRLLRRGLQETGFAGLVDGSQIVPIQVPERGTEDVIRALRQGGFDVRAVLPRERSDGRGLLRVSVNADLPEDVIERFVGAFAAAVKEAGFCSAEFS